MRLRQGWKPHQLVFLDETGLNTKMMRLYGRSFKGERCRASAPHGHWKSYTYIGALRCDGFGAPLLIDGPMTGEMFLAYVREALCPQLHPGDIVIADNLRVHKVAGVREAIEAVGAQLIYLPAYSPDLNPIEMAFAKLKAFLRKAAKRSFPQLLRAIAAGLKTFSSSICRHFFQHAGYASI